MPHSAARDEFFAPAKLWRRAEVLTRPSPVPRQRGIYAGYFRAPPSAVPLQGVHTVDDFALLYIGIAPSSAASGATLRSRLRSHLRKDASQSTLRLTLGCLLADTLGLRLAPQVNGRLTLGAEGEQRLSAWLDSHAAVVWVPREEPWQDEHGLIQHFKTPLNLQGNAAHPFFAALSARRQQFRAAAKAG